MGNVAYRAWKSDLASTTDVIKQLEASPHATEVIRNHMGGVRIEFVVSESGELLTKETYESNTERKVVYEITFVNQADSAAIPDKFIEQGYDTALGIDGGIVGISNHDMLEAIQRFIDPLTPQGVWDFTPNSGFVI